MDVELIMQRMQAARAQAGTTVSGHAVLLQQQGMGMSHSLEHISQLLLLFFFRLIIISSSRVAKACLQDLAQDCCWDSSSSSSKASCWVCQWCNHSSNSHPCGKLLACPSSSSSSRVPLLGAAFSNLVLLPQLLLLLLNIQAASCK
jgi:hypothetical protein